MGHRISFVSDLHLFARRSEAPRYAEAIRTAARRSAVLVLGGDIFDFSWSTLPSLSATVEAAFHWLQRLAADHPQCQIHYLLGNHDYCRPFLDYLEQHSGMIPNFAWHHFYLRLGANAFLHGDVVEKNTGTHERLLEYRSHWLHRPLAGKFSRGAYEVVHRAHLHRPLAYLLHRKRHVARRVLAYLENAGEGPETGLRHVYFGHIHRRMFNYRYRGVTFHNCGAPIKGLRFRILEGSYDGSQPIHDAHRATAPAGCSPTG
jgi:UDP-2,3-diacylglucosamine pyrophosphatase LpxH